MTIQQNQITIITHSHTRTNRSSSHSPSIIGNIHSIVWVIVMYLLVPIHCTLNIDSYIISSLTNYSIQLSQFATTAPAGSLVQLQLPADYSPDDLNSNKPYSGDVFTDGFCPTTCTGVAIAYAGNVFNITGLFPTPQAILFKYYIKNVPNPRIARTVGSYTIRVLDPTNTVIYTQTINSRTFVAKTMTCTGIVTQEMQINFGATAYFQINPLTNPRDYPMALVQLQFPSAWSLQPIVTSTLPTDVYCLSSLQPQLTCSRSSQIITLTSVTFASSVSFQIHSISNPSSTMNAGTVVISTMTSSRYKLDTCSVSISGFEKNYLRVPSISISYTSTTLMDIQVSITFPARVAAGTIIMFTFPASVSVSGSSLSVYLAGNLMASVFPTYIAVNNTVRVNAFTSLMFKPAIQLSCVGVARPRSALIMSDIIINSYYNNNLVSSTTCCQTALNGRSSLQVVSIVTDKPYMQTANSQYTITIITSIVLTSTDLIYIYFPKQYSLGTGSKPCTVSSATAATTGTATCALGYGNIVKISSWLSANTSSTPTTFTITISGITNPSANPSSSPFMIYTLDSAQQIIEYSSAGYVSVSAAQITAMTVTSPNKQVLNSPSQYVIQLTTNGLVLKNYHIVVQLPTQVSVRQSHLGCSVGGKSFPCWYTSASNQIQIRITSDLLSTNVNIVVNGGINPQSLQPSSNFSINVLDGDGNIVQQSSSTLPASPAITMTSTQPFKHAYARYTQASSIHRVGTILIVVQSQYAIRVAHRLIVSYTSTQLLPLSNTTCSSSSLALVSCGVDGSAHTITISNIAYSPNSDTLYVNISNVVALVGSPSIKITLVNANSYKCLQSTTTVNTVVPDIITYTLTQSSYILSSSADITIDYTVTSLSSTSSSVSTLSALSQLAYVLVYVPAQYSTSAANNIYNTSLINGRITITGVTNPNHTQYVSSYFYLMGMSSTNMIIAISVNNSIFKPTCTMPCRTCTSASNCVTCYSWHTLNMLYANATTSTSTCVSHCPRFYFRNSTSMTCQKCNTNCLQCDQLSSTTCLSCASAPTQLYLHQVDHKCYSDCPSGYYESASGYVCRPCTGNCLTCLNQSYCYTCASGYYMYNSQCVSACAPTTYIQSSPLSCIPCPTSNCLHCNSSQCLACVPTYYLYNKQCYPSCPSPLLPTLSRTCKSCECRTCSTYASVCTSCVSTSSQPYLYNSYCYASCPMGTYIGNANTCTSCPLNCITCTHYLLCTMCKQNYAILTTNATYVQCVSTTACPSTTILTLSPTDIPSCLPCTSPCQTCSISVTFCLTCVTNYNLHNYTCVLDCPSPLHAISGRCQSCIVQCLSCIASDPYNCTQCNTGYYIYNHNCYSACPSSTFMDVSGKQCIGCNPLCQTCANSTNCTACVSGYFLFNWFCYSSCPTTPTLYYKYNGACTPCQPQCVSCIDSPIACTACSHPDYLYNSITHECVFECVPPYFRNASTCVICQSPCLSCDTTFNSCLTCNSGYYLYNGTCVSACPLGYFINSTILSCEICKYPCKLCIQNQCLLCQSFAYMYQQICVLQCPADMPYQQPGYCSQCIGIGFCARCGSSSTTGAQICSQCVYPYVLFQNTCLNSCPVNYTVVVLNGIRGCQQTPQFMQYLAAKLQYNKPILPPFFFLGLYLIVMAILVPLSHKIYRFTYHVGYMIGILAIVDALFLFYSLFYITTRYEGQFIPKAPILPIILLIIALSINFIALTILFWLWVQRTIYLTDIRYQQWKSNHTKYWWGSTLLMPILGGPRFHKINYSKMFGKDIFAFRIVSVQKFYQQDILTYLSAIGDLIQIAALAIPVYNIDLGYKGLLFLGYECFGIKLVYWVMLLYDLKKPDRGFFIGDQEQAELEMNKQMQQQAKKLNRMDTQNLVKLVRTKSAEVLKNQKYFGDLDVADFISVYNPDDYQPVIKVPNKKIQKNIYKGKFRKGRKITIQEKLNKFADTVKPKPVIDKKKIDSYLNNLIYWRPPQKKKTVQKKVLPPSEESMLALLEQKQLEYKEDLDHIQLIDQQKQGRQRKYYARPRYDQRTFLDDVDQTIPNQTVQFFYPSHSIETDQKKNSIDFDDLMNLNYAKKKHLKIQENNQERKYQSKRKLHHQPQKKRKNLTGFGQMILKKT